LLSLAYESAPGWPGELSVAQFSLLQAIALSGRISHSGLAWLLGLDQTTVSRSLADLGARGLVHVIRGEDRRERFVALTAGGERAFRRAELVWRRVQGDIRQRCGARRTERLERLLTELSVIAAVSSR
jgi:DNA-binding MarR family transcriptional regulator